MRFRAEQHLRRQVDFQHVRTHGRRHDCGAFMLWYARQAAPAAISAAAGPRKSVPSASVADVLDSGESAAPVEKKSAAAVPMPARLGVVSSRAAVGNAVQRARAKRRLREVFRHHQQRVPAGYDVLLVARHSLNRLEYREIDRKFVDACLKIFPSARV